VGAATVRSLLVLLVVCRLPRRRSMRPTAPPRALPRRSAVVVSLVRVSVFAIEASYTETARLVPTFTGAFGARRAGAGQAFTV
jgi:hypothetical protein